MPDPSVFLMASRGELPGPTPDELIEASQKILNLATLIEGGVQLLWDNGLSRRYSYRDRKTHDLFDYVERNAILDYPDHIGELEARMFRQRWETRAIAIIHQTAQTSTKYWGIDDPAKERYCTGCYWVMPTSKFTHSERTCDYCTEARRRRDDRK